MFKRHKVENMLFNNAIILSEMDGNLVIFAVLLFLTIGLFLYIGIYSVRMIFFNEMALKQ